MSVPKGDRGESSVEFVDTADKIEQRAMEVCQKWPKSYMFIITQRTITLASMVYEQAQMANAIMPKTEAEREQRVIHLQEALGANYAFARKIERAYKMFPICGMKKNPSDMEVKSSHLLEEFMTLCAKEEKVLKGNITYTRKIEIKAAGSGNLP